MYPIPPSPKRFPGFFPVFLLILAAAGTALAGCSSFPGLGSAPSSAPSSPAVSQEEPPPILEEPAAPEESGASASLEEEALPAFESVAPAEEDSLLLVNPWNPLPQGYTVELADLGDGQSVALEACGSLQSMLADARREGLSPLVCSSYRSLEKQQALYDKQVDQWLAQGYEREEALGQAARWVAVPGTSEHQTGLAVDIVSRFNQVLDHSQENTPEQQWLMEHCWEYGFVLRYPADKQPVTGITYEPWHYRYVGAESALEMKELGFCLEEYLDWLDSPK